MGVTSSPSNAPAGSAGGGDGGARPRSTTASTTMRSSTIASRDRYAFRSPCGPAGYIRFAPMWEAAGDAATKELTDLVDDADLERDVKEQAVFALSQQPRDAGVPALIRIARSHPEPGVRRKALFWLGQSGDPRALALFEELLTKP